MSSSTPQTTVWPIEPHTQAKHVILRSYLNGLRDQCLHAQVPFFFKRFL